MIYVPAFGTTSGNTLVLRFDSTTSAHTGTFVKAPPRKKRKVRKKPKAKSNYGRVVEP